MTNGFTNKETNYLKGFGLIFMYIHHFYLSPSRYAHYPIYFFLGEERVNQIAIFMKICVALFVFLSGYGMYVSTIKMKEDSSWMGLIRYSISRYIKLIFPFFFIFWLVQLIFFPTGRYTMIYGTGKSALIYILIDMFGLAHLFHTPTYLGTWWYMSLISLIIWTYPLLFKGIKKYPFLLLLGICILNYWKPLQKIEYFRWLPTFLIGMEIAKNQLFDKAKFFIQNWTQRKKILAGCLGFLGGIVLFYFRQWSFLPIGIREMIIVTYIAFYIFLFLSNLGKVRLIIERIGAHSMTMFLTHTLVRTTFFQDFSYGFYFALLNLLVFTLVTYMIALAIDTLMKQCGYQSFVYKLANKL